MLNNFDYLPLPIYSQQMEAGAAGKAQLFAIKHAEEVNWCSVATVTIQDLSLAVNIVREAQIKQNHVTTANAKV